MPSAACIPDVLDRRVVSLERLEVLDQIIPLAVTQRQMQDRRVVGYDRELRVVGQAYIEKGSRLVDLRRSDVRQYGTHSHPVR